MARPARLERATSWTATRRSIQLSYGRLSKRSRSLPNCRRLRVPGGGHSLGRTRLWARNPDPQGRDGEITADWAYQPSRILRFGGLHWPIGGCSSIETGKRSQPAESPSGLDLGPMANGMPALATSRTNRIREAVIPIGRAAATPNPAISSDSWEAPIITENSKGDPAGVE